MDAPPIQYCRTADGVNIAYWTLGEGQPLIHLLAPVWTHVALEWDVPAMRRWYEQLASHFTVVHFNYRATGLSDSAPEDLSLAAMLRDVEAVAAAADLERPAFLTSYFASQIAIAYTVAHPGEVRGLVLSQGTASGDRGTVRATRDVARGMSHFSR